MSDPSLPPLDPLVGRVLADKFRIVGMVAKGGMGAVYRAVQEPLGRDCAVKVLRVNVDESARLEFERRFFLEASTAARLSHPNTVTLFDYGHTDDGIFFIAMEFLEGRTLHRVIHDEAPMAESRAIHIAQGIGRALREAHSFGVIHRDIKPANVMLLTRGDEEDMVKVLDFGLVKEVDVAPGEELTQAGLFMGSPKYMSPEQIRGTAVDARTDVYALGIVLYEMLAGHPPFDKGPSVKTLLAHVNEAVPPLRDAAPALSEGIIAIVDRCLAKDPEGRFTSMDELLGALRVLTRGPDALTMSGGSALVDSGPLFSGDVPSQPFPGSSGPHVFVARGASGPQVPVSLVPDAVPASVPDAPRRKVPFLVVAGGVALAAAVALFIGFGAGPVEPAGHPTASTGAVPPEAARKTLPSVLQPSVEAPPPAPLPPREASIRVESEPPGATVRFSDPTGEKVCEATPCSVVVKGDGAAEGATLTLHIAKPGRVAETRTLTIGKDASLSVRLRPAAAAPSPVVRDNTPPVYKHDPYPAY